MEYVVTLYLFKSDEILVERCTDVDGVRDLNFRLENLVNFYEAKTQGSVMVLNVSHLGKLYED